jgi:peroxiredoxin Q/BCP
MIAEGKKLPAFSLETDDGKKLSPKDLAGKKWVLFIYPKAHTGGCTTEAQNFRDEFSKFAKKDVPVIGLSKDTVKAQASFKAKHKLPYTLLADPERTVLKALGVIKPKVMYGKKVVGTVRTTILVGEDGTVEKVWSPVAIKGHVEDVLGSL